MNMCSFYFIAINEMKGPNSKFEYTLTLLIIFCNENHK